MSAVLEAIGLGGDKGKKQIQLQQQQIKSQQGQQLATMADSQAKADNELAQSNKKDRGRAMLSYRDQGGSATMGG